MAMNIAATNDFSLAQIAASLERTHEIIGEMVTDFITALCSHCKTSLRRKDESRIERLIDEEAWEGVVLTVLRIALPNWSLRRFIFEDGEWFCSLSQALNLPINVDDTADGRHQSFSAAMMLAMIEALRRRPAPPESGATVFPKVAPAGALSICCDDFA
jgi:hypothetical protein